MRIGSTRRMRAGATVAITAVSIAFLAVLGLAGCAGTNKKHVLPEDGPTMLEIYDQHFDGMQGASVTGASTQARKSAPEASSEWYWGRNPSSALTLISI